MFAAVRDVQVSSSSPAPIPLYDGSFVPGYGLEILRATFEVEMDHELASTIAKESNLDVMLAILALNLPPATPESETGGGRPGPSGGSGRRGRTLRTGGRRGRGLR